MLITSYIINVLFKEIFKDERINEKLFEIILSFEAHHGRYVIREGYTWGNVGQPPQCFLIFETNKLKFPINYYK